MNRMGMLRGALMMLVAGCSSSDGNSAGGPAIPEGEGGTPSNNDSSTTKPAGEGGSDPVPPHTVGKCGNFPAAGTLENITPAQLNFSKWCNPGGGCASDDQQMFVMGRVETDGFDEAAVRKRRIRS